MAAKPPNVKVKTYPQHSRDFWPFWWPMNWQEWVMVAEGVAFVLLLALASVQ